MIDPSPPSTMSSSGLPSDGRGTVVTVGTFDGVHRGHWAVLQEIRKRARETNRRAVLLTFHPHPLRIVRPDIAPPLLTTPNEKREILAESGLDYAVFLRFTPELSAYSPRRFVEDILVRRLGIRELVIGYDHGFGRGRTGDAETLKKIGEELGFAVDVVDPVATAGAPVSSTRIRDAVSRGDMEGAARDLGRPYSIRGSVVRGDGRGRKLGFPTANLQAPDPEKLLPPPGVYAVLGMLRTGVRTGALHLGPRPTFKGASASIELHLLDFDDEIYGEEVRVDFIRHLRPIEAFDSTNALVRQMRRDVAEAREVFDSTGLFDSRSEDSFKG